MIHALSVRNLEVCFPGQTPLTAVDGVSFDLAPGEIVGLVGESGCGKSATANAVMGLLDPSCFTANSIRLGGQELLTLNDASMQHIRGRRISMIFQEPQTALDPVFTIGNQLQWVIRRLGMGDRKTAPEAAEKALTAMGLADPGDLMRRYPHQLSGGMRQRVLIAMATIGQPQVLIADEPTTALDVTTQDQVLGELLRLGHDKGSAMLLITHDLALATSICERIIVMQRGRFVETAAAEQILTRPEHSYTAELLGAIPRLDVRTPGKAREPAARHSGEPLLTLRDLRVSYPVRVRSRRRLLAVRDASLDIRRGEIFGLVGESGCGKTTLAQSLLGLKPADGGELRFAGLSPRGRGDPLWADIRRHVQLVFQDSRASLSPRRTVEQILREPLDHFAIDSPQGRAQRITTALSRVGLEPDLASRFPAELSGGQRQRVALARALVAEPDLIVADEPLSSLDVSVQSRIIELLKALRHELGFALLLVSHDLAVIRQLADRVAVMYLGRIVESAPADALFERPAHPYTRTLLAAARTGASVGRAASRRRIDVGEPPSLLTPPPGCVFHTRCPEAMSRCMRVDPPGVVIGDAQGEVTEHLVHCLLHEPSRRKEAEP